MDKQSDAIKALKEAFDELKTKISGIDKIDEIEVAVVDDQRELATTKKEMKEATDKLEASLEGLPVKWREDMKEHLKTLSNPEKEVEQPDEQWMDMSKMSKEDFVKMGGDDKPAQVLGYPEGTAFRKSFLNPVEIREKAITATSGVGAPLMSALLWNDAIVGDPWAGAGAFQMAPTSPNFQTLEVSNVQFAAGATVGATDFDSPTGTLGTAAERKCLTYTSRILIPNEQEADVRGTLSHIEMMIRLAYGKIRGKLTTTAVQTGSKNGNDVKTGTTLLAISIANAVSKLLGLTVKGNVSDYWPMQPAFMLHPSDMSTLYQELLGKSGVNIDPQSGLMRLGSWQLHVDNQAAPNSGTGTDGNKPDFFGAWVMALIQAQRGRLTLDRYLTTVPGAIALYSSFRFLPVVVNNEAYGQIKVGA